MTFEEMKTEIATINASDKNAKVAKFNESREFVHFSIFYEMLDEPQYTLLKDKNSETWFLAFPKDEKMMVIDAGEEDVICDEYYELYLLWLSGMRAQVQKKDDSEIKDGVIDV